MQPFFSVFTIYCSHTGFFYFNCARIDIDRITQISLNFSWIGILDSVKRNHNSNITINNYLRNDRYQPTAYVDEKEQLALDENNAYKAKDGAVGITNIGIPSIGKDRIGKDSIDKHNKRFAAPSVEEVRAYCNERNNGIDADEFVDFYTAKGWKIGNQPMKDWKAAVRTWEKRREPKFSAKEMEVEELDINEIRRGLGLPEGET